jgi:HEAT repeat protein
MCRRRTPPRAWRRHLAAAGCGICWWLAGAAVAPAAPPPPAPAPPAAGAPAAAPAAPTAPAATPAPAPPGTTAAPPGSTDPALARLPHAALLKRRDPAAVAEMERRFAALADPVQKQDIAVVLLSRRQADQPYFDFLAEPARRAVASTIPFPYTFGETGKEQAGQLSAALLNWAAGHHTDAASAAALAYQEYPADLFLLGLAADPRATAIFLQGLDSPNFLVVYRAAWGLARLRHRQAVPRIVAAADRWTGEASELVARTLVLFDDPAARAAAARLIRDPQLLAALRAEAAAELTFNVGDS